MSLGRVGEIWRGEDYSGLRKDHLVAPCSENGLLKTHAAKKKQTTSINIATVSESISGLAS